MGSSWRLNWGQRRCFFKMGWWPTASDEVASYSQSSHTLDTEKLVFW